MSRRVFVTGYGVVSALGCGVDENLSALISGRSGIGQLQFVKTRLHRAPLAEVKLPNEVLAERAEVRLDPSHSRTFLLGMCAAREAIRMAGCEAHLSEMGFVSSTTVGGVNLFEYSYPRLMAGDRSCAYVLGSMNCADAGFLMASHFGIRRNVSNISTACSSSANAIGLGARLVRAGVTDRVLVGGMDAMTRFSINGFNALEILSSSACRPFDQNRAGITIGEGAAYLVLEAEEVVGSRKVHGEIKGYANTNSAFHQTASSPNGDGASEAIRQTLEMAALQPSEIDYINAHGTGTKNNDLSEGRALATVFGESVPPFSSTKGYTGHTLAAAGALEAVISLLSIKEQLIFPNLNFETPMEELSIRPATTLQRAPIRNVLSNSFGFGGADASLVISKV